VSKSARSNDGVKLRRRKAGTVSEILRRRFITPPGTGSKAAGRDQDQAGTMTEQRPIYNDYQAEK